MDALANPGYEHTQEGPLHWLIWVTVMVLIGVSFAMPDEAEAGQWIILPAVLVMCFIGLCFVHLTIRDEGDALRVRFGPIPVFGKRVPFARIRSAKAARSSIVDGWGIHWVPGRGWTFNLWGFDCVELELDDGSTLRLGSDDAPALAAFLQRKSAARSPG